MQIVIDIDEKSYKAIIEQVKFRDYPDMETGVAIKNGTPLPKGHGRLIEVTNQLEQELFTFQRYTGIDEAPYEDATKILESAPTIIDADKEND